MPDISFSDSKIQQELIGPLLDMLDDGVVVHDQSRRIFLVNRAAEKISGRKRSDLVGLDCHEAFPPHGLCDTTCAFKNGPSEAANKTRNLTVAFSRADGEQRQIKVRSEPILIAGQKKGVLVVFRDVSETSDLRWRLERRHNFHGMIGTSPVITRVFETIRSVGTSEYPVLISGESGTGKELAARAIHKESRRNAGPFVPVNCGALPDNILESELFGHVRGAFTGAIRDKKGRFELADGGTMFLDEVGELPPQMQVKLLRVLQEKTIERVGGEKQIQVDFRIVAATNKDLRSMVNQGTFREDLFYRLCVVPIELPPLRDRREDIPPLVDEILKNIREEENKVINQVSDEAMDRLLKHAWPGNIRELINTLQYASVHCTGPIIEEKHLSHEIRMGPAEDCCDAGVPLGQLNQPQLRPVQPPIAHGRTKLTTEAVEQALAQTGGNKVKAATLLGVGRATLYRFLGTKKQ